MMPELLARPIVGQQVLHLISSSEALRCQLAALEPRRSRPRSMRRRGGRRPHAADSRERGDEPRYTGRMSSTRRFLLSLAIVAAVAGAACGDPPDKEMQQAQGAIDAARAAGADQYARDEFTAAEDALKRSHDAVAQRDYRQALNAALDARERAQTAAKESVNRKATARADADPGARLPPTPRCTTRAPSSRPPKRRACRRGSWPTRARRSTTVRAPCKKRAQRSTRGTTRPPPRPPARVPAQLGSGDARSRRRGLGWRPPATLIAFKKSDRGFPGEYAESVVAEPVAVDEDLGPAGEIDAVLAPLDALPAARRDDRRIARGAAERRGRDQRGARSGPRRGGRPDAPLPDQDPHRVRRLDVSELDIGPRRKDRVVLECRSQPVEALLRRAAGRARRTAGCRSS